MDLGQDIGFPELAQKYNLWDGKAPLRLFAGEIIECKKSSRGCGVIDTRCILDHTPPHEHHFETLDNISKNLNNVLPVARLFLKIIDNHP
jgi:hypothetical protein